MNVIDAKAAVRVCLYARVSEDKNDKSIDDQLREGRAYCRDRGWEVAREYTDFDRPASDPHSSSRRDGFNALRADVAKGEWEAIWVWAADRLARLEAMYFWPAVLPLVEGGVRLVSSTEGELPWGTEEERLVLSLRLLSAHGKAKTTSADVTRGMIDLVLRGGWPGPAPYGYRVVRVGGDGTRKNRGLPKLEPDPVTARVVRLIFDRYSEGWSLRALAAWLNGEGVEPPAGPARTPPAGGRKGRSGLWSVRTVGDMLRNEAYLGHTSYNHRTRAKHTAIAGGRPRPLRPEDKRERRDRFEARPVRLKGDAAVTLKNPPEEWVRKDDTHEPLVTPELFARCGGQLARMKSRNQTARARDYVLAGLLKCGCGAPMQGRVSHHRGGEPVLAYTCAGHRLQGPARCPFHRRVHETVVLNSVSDCIMLALESEAGDAWEAALRERLQAANRDVPAEAARLRGEVADLDGKVTRARRNLALIEDAANVRATEVQIRQWEARLSVLRPRLAEVGKTAERVAAIEERVAEARRLMLSVGQAFLHGSGPAKRLADRAAVREVVDKIVCVWDEGRPSQLAGVRVEFKSSSLLGDAISWPMAEPAEEVGPGALTGTGCRPTVRSAG
jgi:DNA invertase Pin-like site-specific DNA recombinase